jgi:biopolymer transport protein ExbD
MESFMASPKKFFFDVWLAQGKTVYRDVPYEVVTDWIQQGRLLGDDRIRPAKTEEWFLIDKVPAFAGFVPKPDPLRTDARAEALEPVETSFGWRQPEEAEEADPDMIPLIDVSLVLLIFFMMTSSVAAVISTIRVPDVKDPNTVDTSVKMVWIGINYVSPSLPAEFSVNVNSDDPKAKSATRGMTQQDALKRVDEILQGTNDIPEIRIAAHKDISYALVKEMGLLLEDYKKKGKVRIIHVEVGEKR